MSYCASCGEEPTAATNCYTYQFESECAGGQNLEKNDRQEITLSKDQCSWGRCVWEGISGGSGSCIKDGDGNLQDDCASFSNAGEITACHKDNNAPSTKIMSAGLNIISLANPEITFQSKDKESPLGKVGYCLANANSGSGSCTDFKEKPYPGKLKDETINVNMLEGIEDQIGGETYILRFYSKDKYSNQEEIKTAFVYIDNVLPQFEINQEINTVNDITFLSVYLEGVNEPMRCSFALQQVVPVGNIQVKTVERTVQQKEAKFDNLQGLKHNLSVSCEDNQGNINIKQKLYTFDLEERIEIISPESYEAVNSRSVVFKIQTVSGASCGLYASATNEKIADFKTDEQGKMHETNPISGFIEKEYAGDYKAICNELLTDESYEDFFHFSVDFTPPSTKIILKEGLRTAIPAGNDWEEFFVHSAQVNFECQSEGFACAKTFYCLGDQCESITNPDYREYSSSVLLNQSTELCYYSRDIANNPVYQPTCGKLTIGGYGITLESPLGYTFNGDLWGVSKNATFTLKFSTKVPTSECKFDFMPGFNYDAMPQYKVLTPDAQGKYIIENFPTSLFSQYSQNGGTKPLYVRCENNEQELGPEQKLNLEYDPTAPSITGASAQPSLVIEGVSTSLTVETDDKTTCRYSDNSDGSGSDEFDTMEFYFEGADEQALDISHQAIFNINFLGAKKDYVLNVLCKNGAGDLSELKVINFKVDYTAAGAISRIEPAGYIRTKNISLTAETTRRGMCEYKMENEYASFPGNGDATIHTASLGILPEGTYMIPIRCSMADHIAEAIAKFTIDLTPPTIDSVNDGMYTCGGIMMNVMV
ncbi:MAG: hypothetical protein AABX05_01845, partial [Nanoarchaeota archaeon]